MVRDLILSAWALPRRPTGSLPSIQPFHSRRYRLIEDVRNDVEVDTEKETKLRDEVRSTDFVNSLRHSLLCCHLNMILFNI